ncbi:bromodomain-containing protein 4-like [Anopheles bellator]|uniref:bromodomain-containing protein 4-like n=1 Tax=Anopheles bellator TaxID=139047 RepID=UPI002648AF97|nr:bromodomain-containing protein 4-like [Anopheles bellator]
MKLRRVAASAAVVLWCIVLSATGTPVGEPTDWVNFTSQDASRLCQNICDKCKCSGQLMSENVCQCNCDHLSPDAAAEGLDCTTEALQLCDEMDVQCVFNGTAEASVRTSRGCHKMSCYERHHDNGGEGYDGYYGGDDEGYGHGEKELICCKDKKKHKHKHKHKKHKKDKHMKFHVVIKGKLPPQSCHHEGGGSHDYGGYDEYDDGSYRSALQEHQQLRGLGAANQPEVSVWTNQRNSNARQKGFRRPFSQNRHQAAPSAGPRRPPAEPSSPVAPPEPPIAPQNPEPAPVPPPPEPPVTGPPVLPEPPKAADRPEPPQVFSFPPSPPPPPPSRPPSWSPPPRPPPPAPSMRRPESFRHYEEPSYSKCSHEAYDYGYEPQYYQPPPPPPRPSYSSPYRSSARTAPSSFSSSHHPSSYYHPHEEYEYPKHYYGSSEPRHYPAHDDSPQGQFRVGGEREHHPDPEVHPWADYDESDWPAPVPQPTDVFTFNQIVSRQIWENQRALLYTTDPFQPTPRPLLEEFEAPRADTGPVLFPDDPFNYVPYDSSGLNPPLDAFIPPVPPPDPPVAFPTDDNAPVTFPPPPEELYPQPTPPPHYLQVQAAKGFDPLAGVNPYAAWTHQSHYVPSAFTRSSGLSYQSIAH